MAIFASFISEDTPVKLAHETIVSTGEGGDTDFVITPTAIAAIFDINIEPMNAAAAASIAAGNTVVDFSTDNTVSRDMRSLTDEVNNFLEGPNIREESIESLTFDEGGTSATKRSSTSGHGDGSVHRGATDQTGQGQGSSLGGRVTLLRDGAGASDDGTFDR